MVVVQRCLFLLLGCVSSAAWAAPNILLIVSDDQGWNDVGYHNSEIRTPHIDALAKTGVELDCHYVQPQCTPTRVALMTGRYPSRFGLHCCEASNDEAFPVGTLTMARMLREAGYDTGMSGKWHLGSKPQWGPNHHGFDSTHGSLAGAVGMYDHRYRIDSPYAVTWHRDGEFIEEEGHVTDLTADETVRWIRSHTSTSRPWFFYVPLHAVHAPLVEREERWHALNAHIKADDRRLYAAAVSHMDHAVGRMVEALDQTGQRQRTLILFTSDNGAQVHHGGNAYPPPDPKLTNFSSNKPLRGTKTETYEGGYRVPALVNWPAKLAPRKVTAAMHAVDWMPTLARLVGADADPSPRWDGQDVWPRILGEEDGGDDRTFYIVWGSGRQREALRHGDWKIVRNRGPEWELYHLARDPYEQHNLRQDQPEVFESLWSLYLAERAKDAP
jgi:arylsulfatase A-like enzyme